MFYILINHVHHTPYGYYFTSRPFWIQATRINILEYS
ncbi:hypothetical protein BACCAP_03678 [Pseudoflavonifractor capillosus ATCC 29799]|uniref:Uncharacterized protein n=1 Tax=Pseudoflavonifractor capillosus ATCC 29799 TaxID=411467 RepID=A6NZM7_9FIRM|nr:hypothetical protein BACCAP_03678 [Pseudoflavonifractor capillosus ATCC 29799]